MLGSCSGSARAVRVPVPPGAAEVYRITCGKRIGACRDKAAEVCGGQYAILESAGASIEPERVSSAPGPRSTGPRYQRPKWVGHMMVSCGSSTQGTQSPERLPPVAVTPRPPAGGICVPGETRECLGPGACRGAQACLPDALGFGRCDCGERKPVEATKPPRIDAGAGLPDAGRSLARDPASN